MSLPHETYPSFRNTGFAERTFPEREFLRSFSQYKIYFATRTFPVFDQWPDINS